MSSVSRVNKSPARLGAPASLLPPKYLGLLEYDFRLRTASYPFAIEGKQSLRRYAGWIVNLSRLRK